MILYYTVQLYGEFHQLHVHVQDLVLRVCNRMLLCIETDFWSFQYCKTLMTIQSSLDLHQAIECSLCQHVMVYVCGQNMVAS